MSFLEELEPKLAEIDRAARKLYEAFHLNVYGYKIDDYGRVVDDPLNRPPNVVRPLVDEQQLYDDFLSSLSSVIARFEGYYYLDPLDMTIMTETIGGKANSPAPTAYPTNVYDRLHYAADEWMLPVLKMIDPEEWSRPADEAWRGTAAQVFFDSFLMPFHRASEQQMACTKILGIAAQSVHDGIAKTQDDLLSIADASIAALRMDVDVDWSGELTSISIIAGAVGLFLTVVGAPASAGVVVGGISLGAGISSVYAARDDSGDRPPWQITGSDAPTILESVWDCLVTLQERTQNKDREMADLLMRDLVNPEAFASSGLTLPRQALDGPDAFGDHTVETTHPGVPIYRNEAVVTVVHLYEAGTRNLPSAAYQYGQAASFLWEALPDSFVWLYPQTSTQFNIARNRVGDILSDIRSSLTASGETLVQIAADYELTDEQSAEVMRQIDELASPTLGEAPPMRVGGV